MSEVGTMIKKLEMQKLLPLFIFFCIALLVAIIENASFFIKLHSLGVTACIFSGTLMYIRAKNKNNN